MIDTVTKYYFNGQEAGYIVTYVDSSTTKAVPKAEDNTDYQEILEWVANGGTIVDNGA